MFSFSGGGSASAGAFNNGNYNFGPVEYGNGGIVMGDFKTGDIVQSGSATAGGGNSTQSFAFNPPQQQQQGGTHSARLPLPRRSAQSADLHRRHV